MAKKSTARQDNAETIPADLKGLIESGQEQGIDTSILLNDVIECFGGPHRLARAIHQEFINAKPGSMVRTRTIEMINRLVMANTQYELSNLKKPADLNDEELEREAERLLRRREASIGKDTAEEA